MSTRRRNTVSPIAPFVVLLLATVGCNNCKPNPTPTPTVTGGPSIGPVVDVDTNGSKAKYYYTSVGNPTQEITQTKSSFEIHPDLTNTVAGMMLIDSKNKKWWPEKSLKITFDDNSTLVATPGNSGGLTWTCTDKNGVSHDLNPVAENYLYVDDCMKGTATSITMGSDTGDWFQIELKE